MEKVVSSIRMRRVSCHLQWRREHQMSAERWRDFNLPHINTSNYRVLMWFFISFTFDCSSIRIKVQLDRLFLSGRFRTEWNDPEVFKWQPRRTFLNPLNSTESCFSASWRISSASETAFHIMDPAGTGTNSFKAHPLNVEVLSCIDQNQKEMRDRMFLSRGFDQARVQQEPKK